MKEIMKIDKSLKVSGLLIKIITQPIDNETRKEKDPSPLETTLACKCVQSLEYAGLESIFNFTSLFD